MPRHAYTRHKSTKPAAGGEPAAGVQLTRNSPEVKARRAQTLLDSPDLRGQFDKVRQQLISDIETAELDGSSEAANRALEKIRQLQALQAVKLQILLPVIGASQAQDKGRV